MKGTNMKKQLLDVEKLRDYLEDNDYTLEGIIAYNYKEGGHISLPLRPRTKFLKDILAFGSRSQAEWDEFWKNFMVEVDV